MKKISLLVICLLLLNSACVSSKSIENNASNKNVFRIVPKAFDDQGVLSLKLSIKLIKPARLYNWRGHIYPLWNYGLFCEVITRNRNDVKIEIMNKVMPLFPHPQDFIETDEYSYPEHLVMKILKKNGQPYHGCLDLALIYNTEKIKKYSPNLSVLNIKSNTINVCNK